ncbi:MAG: hypothetical protein IPG64_18695 [Haliea sp.]|nr:hypothetical protein [Haliea sp.]
MGNVVFRIAQLHFGGGVRRGAHFDQVGKSQRRRSLPYATSTLKYALTSDVWCLSAIWNGVAVMP